jgi:hypothetical protein
MGGDFTHPTAQGAEIVGSLIYNAIIKEYEKRVESLESRVWSPKK